jgi:hypothetical protein
MMIMKNIIKSVKVFALLLATLFVSNSCSNMFDNPLKDKETGEDIPLLLIDQNVFDTQVMVYLVDAETGQAVIANNLNVYIFGDDADKVVDFEGKKRESYRASTGSFEFAIDPNVTPSLDKPLDITLYAETEDGYWFSFMDDVYISETGYNNVVIQMYNNEGAEVIELEDDEFELDDEGLAKQASQLKSALAPMAVAPFTLLTNSAGAGIIKTDFPKPISSGAYLVYYKIQPKRQNLNFKIAARFYTGPAGNDFGYYGTYRNLDNKLTVFNTLQKKGEYKNIKTFSFNAATKEQIDRCTKGLIVKFTNESNLNASPKFDYIMTFANGSTVKGTLTVIFPRYNASTSTWVYISNTTVNGFYYPTDNLVTSFEIFPDAQFEFTTGTTRTLQNGACGQTIDFAIKAKSDLKPYRVITNITCESSQGLVATPSMQGTITQLGTDVKTRFLFDGGIANLQLKDNTDYIIEGSYGNTSASFNFTTNPNNINSVIASSLAQFPELKDVRVVFGPQPTDATTPRDITITIIYKQEHCPF